MFGRMLKRWRRSTSPLAPPSRPAAVTADLFSVLVRGPPVRRTRSCADASRSQLSRLISWSITELPGICPRPRYYSSAAACGSKGKMGEERRQEGVPRCWPRIWTSLLEPLPIAFGGGVRIVLSSSQQDTRSLTLLAARIKTPGQTAQIKSSLICLALVSPSGFSACVCVYWRVRFILIRIFNCLIYL